MIRQDLDGNLWNKGTKIGLAYMVITVIVFGVTTTQDPNGQLAWLEKFSFLIWLAPLAAASHAYVAGQLSHKQPNKPAEVQEES